MTTILNGLLLPLLGTAAGAALVFFLKGNLSIKAQKSLEGFAGGVMVYACFCSLIAPALEYSSCYGLWAFMPVAVGIWIGILFLIFTERFSAYENEKGGKLFMAVTLHNIPEGMAVGVSVANALISGKQAEVAFTLALGIALQNLPEGAIVALPARGRGESKAKAFLKGVLSGVAELASALLALLFTSSFTAVLPYFLGIACGCMLYVTLEELVGEKSRETTLFFVLGFTLMLIISTVAG